MIKVENLTKSFTLHHQDSVKLAVFENVSFEIAPGECVALSGPSGTGKSTMLRLIYGNYIADHGKIFIQNIDIASSSPREIISLRKSVIGYVSQFLRVVPRVSTLDVVAETLLHAGHAQAQAYERAHEILDQLQISEKLRTLSPMTFSGGEQQRVNIARVMCHDFPVLLLDEPTASLDEHNKHIVLDLIAGARDRGATILGIFHDHDSRKRICTRSIDFEALIG